MLLTFLLTSNPVTNHHSFFYKISKKRLRCPGWVCIFFGFPLQSVEKRGNECLPTTFVGHNSVACPILELISIFFYYYSYMRQTLVPFFVWSRVIWEGTCFSFPAPFCHPICFWPVFLGRGGFSVPTLYFIFMYGTQSLGICVCILW